MDGDSSEEENINQDSPGSLRSSDQDARPKDNKNRRKFKSEREEGEIESDVSASSGDSPQMQAQIAAEGLFSEKVHATYSDDSMSNDGNRKPDEKTSYAEDDNRSEDESDDDIESESNSRIAPDEPVADESKHAYREVKMVSSSDENMSTDNEEGAHEEGEEEEETHSERKSEAESEDEESDSSDVEISDEGTNKRRSDEDKVAKTSDVIDISDVEDISDHGDDSPLAEDEKESSELSKERHESIERTIYQSKVETESLSEDEVDIAKPRSLIFKKAKKNSEKHDKRDASVKKYSDDEGEEVVVDHLDIAAPQQALLRKSKKKSMKTKMKSRDKEERLSHKGERSRPKEERKRHKEEKRRADSREKEKRGRHEGEYEGRKHKKHEGNKHEKYEKRGEQEAQRLRTVTEKKRVEDDLRRKALEGSKRSKEESTLRQPKDSTAEKEWNRKEEKGSRKDRDKVERNRGVSRERKEAKEPTDENDINKSSKEGRDRKEHRKEKAKYSKNVTDKGKKRRREKSKSKSNKEKRRSESEDSEEEDMKDNDTKTPASKRPRSADLASNESKDADKEDDLKGTEGEYDDISPASSDLEMSPPPSPIELKKPTYYPAIMGCRDVKEFQWLNKIEEGTYGVVYRARDNRTDEIVALKRLKMEKEKEGFPITSLREINTLLTAQHPNIVTVREIVVGSNMDKIYIVMDYVEHDLKALMETMTQPFLVGEVKTLMIQLLKGVNHLHDNWILHRDIKASNLLLSHKGILKVGDFGLAREYGSPLKNYTPIVVTLWYRAPELLLGGKEYKTAIDLWSVGCVFAELLLMKPLFPGKSEIDQINRIFKELGTPNDNIWPGPPSYSEYSMVKKTNFASHPYNVLRNRFGATFTDKGFNLLNRFLTYDPKRRITAEDALNHEYFEESPLPVDPSMFPTWPAKSELAHRAVRKHNASPKAPEGGGAASKLANEDANLGFHMPAATKGFSAKGTGFNLKF